GPALRPGERLDTPPLRWHPHPDPPPQAGEGAIEGRESRAIHIAPVRKEMLFAKCGAFCSLPRLRGSVGVGAAAGENLSIGPGFCCAASGLRGFDVGPHPAQIYGPLSILP